jgi:hypothetical protein
MYRDIDCSNDERIQNAGKELYMKIIEVMKAVPGIEKDGKVDYTSKKTGARTNYDYIKAETVIGTIRKEMAKVGLVMYPVKTNMIDKQGSTVCLIVTYRIADSETGQFIEIQTIGSGTDIGDKNVYKAMTGAYKYALLQSYMIAVGWSDPDANASDEIHDRTETKSEMTPKQAQSMLFRYGKYERDPQIVNWVYRNDIDEFNRAIDDPKCPYDVQTACIVFQEAFEKKK